MAAGTRLLTWLFVLVAPCTLVVSTKPWQPGPDLYDVDFALAGATTRTKSLYPEGGKVVVAVGPLLQEVLADPADGGKHWYFIEIYDHTCPHCWYAVPLITDVAASYRGVSQLKTTAMNCHMDVNREMCFVLGLVSKVQTYPAMMLCPPGESAVPVPLGAEAEGTLAHLPPMIRGQVLLLRRCHHRFVTDDDSLLSAAKIAEWIQAVTGLQPSDPTALRRGADFVDYSKVSVSGPPGVPGWRKDDLEGQPGFIAWSPKQRYADALRGFISTFYQEYKPSSHSAAVQVTRFLALHFPVARESFTELLGWLESSGPHYDDASFREKMKSFSSQLGFADMANNLDSETYQTCGGSTCAMWTLLHVTLSSLAVWKLAGDTRVEDVSINDAMDFVRAMVSNFLSCGACREDFLHDFDTCANGRCFAERGADGFVKLPLWIWRAHNAVSLKVAASSPDAKGIDRRWPMYLDCPKCWRDDVVMGQAARQLRSGEIDIRVGSVGARSLSQHTHLFALLLDAPFSLPDIFWFLIDTYMDPALVPKEALGKEAARIVDNAIGVAHAIVDDPGPDYSPQAAAGVSSAMLFCGIASCCVVLGVATRDDLKASYRTWRLRRGLPDDGGADPLDEPARLSQEDIGEGINADAHSAAAE